MALIIRIDVDRPYGRHPFHRHVLSRLSSDFYCPRIKGFGYLAELEWMLEILNEHRARACVFFRQCTLPSDRVMKLIEQGRHRVGLHLENSRSFAHFCQEKVRLERHIGGLVSAVSKHGSGGARYGRHHYAPYEPEKYVQWARDLGMTLFLGNLEDPSLPAVVNGRVRFFPSAFWLEPHWRDTTKFTTQWLLSAANEADKVLLVHPDNVRQDPSLAAEFQKVTASLKTEVFA